MDEVQHDSQTMPPYSELLKFLDMQAQHFDSITSEWKPLTTTHWSYAATVERVTVRGMWKRRKPSSKFQGMSREERWEMVRKTVPCKNCSKSGHIMSEDHAPPMCKKYFKHHHTLLCMEADPKMEGK